MITTKYQKVVFFHEMVFISNNLLTLSQVLQYSGDLWGFPFLRFIRPAEISDTGEHAGLHGGRKPEPPVLFFLTISVVAVQARVVLQSAPPYPPEPDEVRAEPAGSRTESGVIRPSSSPDSDKGK